MIILGEKWRSRRKMLTPSFHFTILQQFIPTFFHHANMLLTKFSHLHMETKNGIDIVPHTIDFALQSICGKLGLLNFGIIVCCGLLTKVYLHNC